MPNVRRQYPKITGNFTVQLTRSDGNTIDATATEISSNTILVECDMLTATQILPELGEKMFTQIIEVDTLVNLPLITGESLLMSGQGIISKARRITQDTYHLCIELSAINDENYSRLSRFIEQHL